MNPAFVTWLDGEIHQADNTDPSEYVHGRRRALREVKLAWNRSLEAASQ